MVHDKCPKPSKNPKLQNPIVNEMCKIKLKLIIYTSCGRSYLKKNYMTIFEFMGKFQT
jgi:hypothetical protein